MLRAPFKLELGLFDYTARDEFNQSAGALAGKTAVAGGAWGGAGDADDFSVEATGHTAQRTAVSDTVDIGRAAPLGASATATAAQIDVRSSVLIGSTAPLTGLLLRYVDASNYAYARIQWTTVTGIARVGLARRLAASNITYSPVSLDFPIAVDTWYTLRAVIDATGSWWIWVFPRGGVPGEPLLTGQHSELATGGALASGQAGLFDYWSGGTAVTRSLDNFLAWVPTLDAVLHPSQSAELRTDGMFREDATGTAYGPVSYAEGGVPRLPPTGTTQILLKGSRGDFDQVPDRGIDDISARVFYRPSWLFIPGS